MIHQIVDKSIYQKTETTEKILKRNIKREVIPVDFMGPFKCCNFVENEEKGWIKKVGRDVRTSLSLLSSWFIIKMLKINIQR